MLLVTKKGFSQCYAKGNNDYKLQVLGGPEIEKVIASTLPYVPGMEIVEAKPIIYGSVSHIFAAWGNKESAKKVGVLMKEAQEEILKVAIRVGCNSVLGMTFNVTNDSSGHNGRQKLVIVNDYGTPCNIVKKAEATMPIVEADAIVDPLYYASTPVEVDVL